MITQYHNKEPSGKWVLDSKNKKNSKTTQNLNTNQNLIFLYNITQSSSVQLLNRVQLFATPWTAGCQASLSITNSRSLLKLMSIESVMPSNHLILCRPLLLLPSISPEVPPNYPKFYQM